MKRSFESPTADEQHKQQLPPMKTRVVLGDLTDSSNIIGFAQFSNAFGTQNGKPKPKFELKKADKEVVLHASAKEEIVSSSDDARKYGCAPLIYHHLRSLEVEDNRRPSSDYLEKIQKHITPYMRQVLVSWLVEVAEEYKLVSDTLYLTVCYIDRFLSSHVLSKTKLQLLGVSCMLVASNHEEITPSRAEDFCYITDNSYTKDEVLIMERNILKLLNFELGNPTTKTFLRIFARAAQKEIMFATLQFEFLGSYLAELSLLDYRCVRFLPSIVAASVIFLSRFTVHPNKHPWSLALQQLSGYRPSQFKDCVLCIHEFQLNRKRTHLQAVKDKYNQNKFESVASLSCPKEIPTSYFEAI